MKVFVSCCLALLMSVILVGCNQSNQNTGNVATSGAAPTQANGAALIRNPPVNAAPIGMEIGYTNYIAAKNELDRVLGKDFDSKQELLGSNVTEIYLDSSSGQHLNIESLNYLKLYFDSNQKLAGVVMLQFGDGVELIKALKEKYTLISDKRKGDLAKTGTVIFEKGNTTIEVLVAAMVVQVKYLDKSFVETYKSVIAGKEAKEKSDKTKAF